MANTIEILVRYEFGTTNEPQVFSSLHSNPQTYTLLLGAVLQYFRDTGNSHAGAIEAIVQMELDKIKVTNNTVHTTT